MKKANVLVVVDLQDGFYPSYNEELMPVWDKTVNSTVGLIQKCRRKGWTIVVAEFDGYGKTVPDVIEACGGEHLLATKTANDGSYEIRSVLQGEGIRPSTIRVCGVNTPYCVKATAMGLIDLYPKARTAVVAKAVADVSRTGKANNQRWGLEEIRGYNVKVSNMACSV